MADLAQTNKASEIWQRANLCLQEGCALGDFRRFWLVGGGRALHRIGDHYAFEHQTIIGMSSIGAARQLKAGEGLIEEITRPIAGKGPTRPISSRPPGGQAHDQ